MATNHEVGSSNLSGRANTHSETLDSSETPILGYSRHLYIVRSHAASPMARKKVTAKKSTAASQPRGSERDQSAATERPTAAQGEVKFDFIKSNFFRVIRADGAFGGIAPNGAIHMGIYSERSPLPKRVVHKLNDNMLGAEITSRRETRDAFVREMEVDIVLELAQAIALRTWLDDKIKQKQLLSAKKPEGPVQ
jgi:hypothetical protein